ncbi:MAG: hypothetical protein ACREJO_12270 [Phycisphaerales bacterium]
MQLSERLAQDRAREIDETHRLVEAIAQELWGRYGGGQDLDWAAVDRQLGRIVDLARSDAHALDAPVTPMLVASHSANIRSLPGWGKFPHRHRLPTHR